MPEFREFQRVLDGEHIIAEHNGTMSREQVMLLRGDRVQSGTVMAMVTATKLWTPLDPAGPDDGRRRARGVLFHKRDARPAADTRRAVVHLRDTDVNGKKIIWPAGLSEADRKTQEGYLAEERVLVRY